MIKRKSNKKVNKNVFYSTFVGEYIDITTNITTKLLLETEQGIVEQQIPLIRSGYLLDQDNFYYYLGDTPNSVCKAVKKSVVADVSIVEVKSEMDDILDNMPMPRKKQEMN